MPTTRPSAAGSRICRKCAPRAAAASPGSWCAPAVSARDGWPSAPEMGLKEALEQGRRAGDYRALAANHDRPLHQLRIRQQEVDDRRARDIVGGVQLELGEAFVLAHQLAQRFAEPIADLFERRAVGRRLEILDRRERD